MSKATENKIATTETAEEPKTRGLSIVIPQDLYDKIENESWELRERSMSGTVRAICEKYFVGK